MIRSDVADFPRIDFDINAATLSWRGFAAVALLAAGCDGSHVGEVSISRERGERRELPPELSGYAQAVEASRLDFIRVDAQREDGTEPWASKFRGMPYLPEGAAYPLDPHGLPLTLLAQLNFEEMPALEGYPRKGILQFFISGEESREHVWGMLSGRDEPYDPMRYFASMQDQKYFRVICRPEVIRDRKRLAQPPGMLYALQGFLPITEEARLSFRRSRGPVLVDDYRFARTFGEDARPFFARFGEREQEIAQGYIDFSYERSIGKVGGYASFVQGDPRSIRPDEDWLLLLEIESADPGDGVEILWGDGGVANLLIRREDLRKLDFSRVVYYWDNH